MTQRGKIYFDVGGFVKYFKSHSYSRASKRMRNSLASEILCIAMGALETWPFSHKAPVIPPIENWKLSFYFSSSSRISLGFYLWHNKDIDATGRPQTRTSNSLFPEELINALTFKLKTICFGFSLGLWMCVCCWGWDNHKNIPHGRSISTFLL